MKHILLTFSFVLMATAGWAGWESSLRPWLYSASFEAYDSGAPLTNGTVVSGGYWTVPKSAQTSATFSEERYGMSYLTASDKGLVLNPSDMVGFGNDKAVLLSMKMIGFDSLPAMDAENDRAALIILAPKGGEPSFQGWSKDGWVSMSLPSGLVKPVVDEWYDISIRMMTDPSGKSVAQYRIFTGMDYEPLRTDDGKYWLDVIGTESVVREVEVRGTGNLEYLKGSEMKNGLAVGVKQR